jgi:hypothetical protein
MSIAASLTAWWTQLRAPRLAHKSLQQAKAALDATYGPPQTALGRFNRDSAARLGWTPGLCPFELKGWDDADGFAKWQDQIHTEPDGWFGNSSYHHLMARHRDHIIVGGYPYPAPPGISVRNWHAPGPGVRRLPGDDRRGRAVNMAVGHESVTSTWRSTQEVLARRGLGVHLMVTEEVCPSEGVRVTQHADLLWTRLAHAAGQNGPSVGIEYVSPYYPEARTQIEAELPTITPAGWSDAGRDGLKGYRMLPPRMLEAGTILLEWLTMPEGPVGIPREWRGLDKAAKAFALNRIGGTPRRPGIWAHTYTDHADGAIPILYAWLRLERSMSAEDAYRTAMELGRTPRRTANLASVGLA